MSHSGSACARSLRSFLDGAGAIPVQRGAWFLLSGKQIRQQPRILQVTSAFAVTEPPYNVANW